MLSVSKTDVLRLGEAVVVRLRRLTARPLQIKNVAGTGNPGLQDPKAATEQVLQSPQSAEKAKVNVKVNEAPAAGDVKSPEDADKGKLGSPSVLTQPIRPCQRRI